MTSPPTAAAPTAGNDRERLPDRVDALTADGAIVAIRPLTSADTGVVTGLFRRASAASLRLRFFTTDRKSVV